MNEPKYQVGQKVEAQISNFSSSSFAPATITGVRYSYTVSFNVPNTSVLRDENQIRLPRPSEEEAWEKATMLIGIRSRKKGEYCCLDGQEKLDFDRETRHQVYGILGSAGIKIEPEVKADVRRLIGVADSM